MNWTKRKVTVLWCLHCQIGWTVTGTVPSTCPCCHFQPPVGQRTWSTLPPFKLSQRDRDFLRCQGIDPETA